MFSIRRRIFGTKAAAALCALAVSAAPARADFISDLVRIFTPPQQQQAAPVLSPVRPRTHPKVRTVNRQPGGTATTRPGPKPQVALLQVLKDHGAREAFMADPTLRSGDLVVTETGISLFSGAHGGAHTVTDFRPVALSTLRNRSSLIELERVSGLLLARPAVASAPAEMPLTVSLARKAKSGGVTTVQPVTCVPAPDAACDERSLSATSHDGPSEP